MLSAGVGLVGDGIGVMGKGIGQGIQGVTGLVGLNDNTERVNRDPS